jgi:hypothetical protein
MQVLLSQVIGTSEAPNFHLQTSQKQKLQAQAFDSWSSSVCLERGLWNLELWPMTGLTRPIRPLQFFALPAAARPSRRAQTFRGIGRIVRSAALAEAGPGEIPGLTMNV